MPQIKSILGRGPTPTARAALAVALAVLVLSSGVGVAAAVPSADTTDGFGSSTADEFQTTATEAPAESAGPEAALAVPDASVSAERVSVSSLDSASVEAGKRRALSASSEASLDAGTARITGQVFYEDSNGNYHPARQVQVTVQDKDWVEKSRYATTRTDDRGRFTLTFDASAPDWGSSSNVIVEVYANNPAAEVNPNYVGGWYEFETDKFSISNGETKNFGSMVPADNNPAWEAADYALTAKRRIADEGNGWNRPKVHIAWPKSDWPKASPFPGFEQIILPDRDVAGWGSGTVHHEYGHRVMGTLYENAALEWPDYSVEDRGDKCHNIRSDTNEGFAWVEGWAQFTESVVADDPTVHWGSLESTDYYDADYNGKCYAGDTGHMDGYRAEGSVASLLWDLYDGDRHYAGGDDDDLTYSLDTIYGKVDSGNDGNVYDLWDSFVTSQNHDELREIYAENGIPRQDRFEGSTTRVGPGTARSSIDAQVTGPDVDRYEVALDRGERLTVTADREHGFAELSVRVEAPDGSSVASTADENWARTQWTAREAGTYTVVVANTSGDTADYTLSVDTRKVVTTSDENNDRAATATPIGTDLFDGGDRTGRETATATGGYLPGDNDYYELTLSPGQSAVVEVETPTGQPVAVDDWRVLDEHLHLLGYGAGGQQFLSNDGGSERTYYIQVGGNARATTPINEYDITVTSNRVRAEEEDNDEPGTATDLDPRLDGEYASGTNKWSEAAFVQAGHQSSDDDYYVLTLDEGDHVWAKAWNDSLDLELLDGSYNTQIQTATSGGAVSWTADRSGTYLLKVDGGWVAEYWLQVGVTDAAGYDRLEADNTEDEATDVPNTDSLYGSDTDYEDLAIASTDDTFAVDLQAGQQFNATLTQRATDGIGLSVSGPGTPRLADYWDDSHVRFTAPRNGTYYLTVSGEDGATAGAYDLSIETGSTLVGPGWIGDVGGDLRNVSDDLWTIDVPPVNGTDSDSGNADCGDQVARFDGTVSADTTADHARGEGHKVGSIDGDCAVRVTVVGADSSADLDLFVTLDGRTATASDFDRRSATAGANETLTIPASALDADATIGASVRAYTGTSDYTLVVESVDDDE